MKDARNQGECVSTQLAQIQPGRSPAEPETSVDLRTGGALDGALGGAVLQELRDRESAFSFGDQIGGYRILEKIGCGGFGEVYRARDEFLRRDVAIKTLAGIAADPQHQARFEREARMLASVDHPGLVRIFAVERVQERLLLVMELVQGSTLGSLLRAGSLSDHRALELLEELCSALGEAHRAGLVHRDLKPANLMITPAGALKVLDFGLARPAKTPSGESSEAALTEEGTILGTLAYMSPEQLQGGDVLPPSDVYAVGVLAYQMLTGGLPFHGDSRAELISTILRDHPDPPKNLRPDLSEGLNRLILQCLERRPADRFADAVELESALRDLCRGRVRPAPARRGDGDHDAAFAEARTAASEGDWERVVELLSPLPEDRFSARAAEDFALALWWTGRFDRNVRWRERAFAGYVRARDARAAARVGLLVAEDHLVRCRPSVANGWARRVERLLRQVPESVEHGWLFRYKGIVALEVERDPQTAVRLSQEAQRVATALDSVDLLALAIQDEGRGRIALGETGRGLDLVDEAMVYVASGELQEMTSGRAYCNMMAVCEERADYARAREWVATSEDWCEDGVHGAYPGICRIRTSTLERLRGAYDDAEEIAARASEELAELPAVAGPAHAELGEIHLRRGRLQQAEAAFLRARSCGHEPLPGHAELLLARGDAEGGLALLDRALDACDGSELARARLLPTRARCRIALGLLDEAEDDARELERVARENPSPALLALAHLTQARVAEAGGDLDRATRAAQSALKAWRQVDAPYEGAQTRLLLGALFEAAGNVTEAGIERDLAVQTFRDLGIDPPAS